MNRVLPTHLKKSDPETWERIRKAYNAKRNREWRLKNPEKYRAAKLSRKPEKYDLDKTSHKRARPTACEVCGEFTRKGERLCYDHDHSTGKFRGWLCHGCNLSIGFAKDNPETLRALATYLERHIDGNSLNPVYLYPIPEAAL